MTITQLAVQILSEIGLLTGTNASENDVTKVRYLVNKCMRWYNLHDFLHFTKEEKNLGHGKEFTFDSVPLKVDRVYTRNNSEAVKLTEVGLSVMPEVDGFTAKPKYYSYDRKIDETGKICGLLKLNQFSNDDVIAVITHDLPTYENNGDNILMPPEYENLIAANVQYRLLSNEDVSDTLKRDKRIEMEDAEEFIKRLHFSSGESPKKYATPSEAFFFGTGRL